MNSIDTFAIAWNALSEAEQLNEWRSFVAALDAGDAGYHRFYSVLMVRWDRGEAPALIEAEVTAENDAEMMQEAAWEALHIDSLVEDLALMSELPF